MPHTHTHTHTHTYLYARSTWTGEFVDPEVKGHYEATMEPERLLDLTAGYLMYCCIVRYSLAHSSGQLSPLLPSSNFSRGRRDADGVEERGSPWPLTSDMALLGARSGIHRPGE